MPTALHLVENASVPGDPRVWPECQTLVAAGWDVAVVCPKGRTRDTASAELVDGVRIHRFELSPHAGGAPGYIREYGKALQAMRSLVRSLARHRPIDVVHASTPPDFSLYAARALRKRGTATILDHHDLSPELFEAKFGRRALPHRTLLAAERAGFRLADVVISPNESFRRIAIERGGVAPDDVFVVRNGPDPGVFKPVPADPGIRGLAPHVLGYVGLMGSQDGVLEAIDALGRLARRRSDWHAVFVGDGDVLPEAKRLVDTLGLRNAVTFLGFVSDRARLVQLIASCDICLSPEPLNALNDSSTLIKVAEYMAVGRPVVAFRLRETEATAGGAAVLAATTDEWVDALDALLDDPGRRAAMGAEGRERVVGQLSWAHSQPVLLEAYGRALARAEIRSRPRKGD